MGRKPMTPQQRERMRTRILDAARTRFLEDGMACVSMRQIARGVGVSSMTLYLYYEDRRDIVRHIVAEGFELLGAAMAAELGGSPADRVVRVGQAYVRFALTNARYYVAMYQYLSEDGPCLDGLVADASRRPVDILAAAIARTTQMADPRCKAAALWSALHGLAQLSIDGQLGHHGIGPGEIPELVATATTQLLAA